VSEVAERAPLYLTVEEAARYAGIGIGAMRDYMASADPPPLLVIGTRRYVQRAGLARYLEDKQTWHYDKERQ
jgi:transketolase C-terminal domain/subunit